MIMIKLNRNPAPTCLTPENIEMLITEFKKTKNSVWNIPELKSALLSSSHNKCAYCECNISEESKYMEVEHFKDKHSYPDKVVTWENLLPSCKRCNGTKGTHDVIREPIVNSYNDNPKDHLAFRLYRLRALSPIGQNTIDVLRLNDNERVVKKRFEVGEALQFALETASTNLEAYKLNNSTRNRNRLLEQLRLLLAECIETASYAATSATVLHSDPNYKFLKVELATLGLWDDELESLDKRSSALILQPG